ncbi:MAG TPA: hypothetical protein VLV50_00490 [Stellaceae bacterium]|nr:hypothetical protein [Stellaceae bacterium]
MQQTTAHSLPPKLMAEDEIDPDLARPRPRSRLKLAAWIAARRFFTYYWDAPTNVASLLSRIGLSGAAEKLLGAAFESNPFDRALGMQLGDLALANGERQWPIGSVARGIFLLEAIYKSFPSERLTAAYFENLEALMSRRQKRSEPGLLVLGMGSGRVGSTALAAMIAANPDVLSTHENPPLVWWSADPAQVDFHVRRFRILTQYFPAVFDWSSWWLGQAEAIGREFPNYRAIGISRDVNAVVRSFMRITAASENSHAPMHNGIWMATRWSPTREAIPSPDARHDPNAAKEAQYRRAVVEYEEHMATLAARLGNRFLQLRTEALDELATREKVGTFLGLGGPISLARRNVGSAHDSSSGELWF